MAIVITEKNQMVLEHVAKYYVLTRKMIQQMCFPDVKGSRSVCERIRKLKSEGFISEANMQVVARGQSATPVYFPNKKTAETLAAIYDEESWLSIFTKPPSGRLLFHWIEIANTHHLVRSAAEHFDMVDVPKWYNEWEPINKETPNKSKQFSLYTVLRQEPALTCAPDAAFLASCAGHKKVFYIEVDRGTDSIKRIVSKKPEGYATMASQRHHLKHFPESTLVDFSVLFITTSEHRRDELARQLQGKNGCKLWKTACRDELNAETFFSEAVWRDSELTSMPLISV